MENSTGLKPDSSATLEGDNTKTISAEHTPGTRVTPRQLHGKDVPLRMISSKVHVKRPPWCEVIIEELPYILQHINSVDTVALTLYKENILPDISCNSIVQNLKINGPSSAADELMEFLYRDPDKSHHTRFYEILEETHQEVLAQTLRNGTRENMAAGREECALYTPTREESITVDDQDVHESLSGEGSVMDVAQRTSLSQNGNKIDGLLDNLMTISNRLSSHVDAMVNNTEVLTEPAKCVKRPRSETTHQKNNALVGVKHILEKLGNPQGDEEEEYDELLDSPCFEIFLHMSENMDYRNIQPKDLCRALMGSKHPDLCEEVIQEATENNTSQDDQVWYILLTWFELVKAKPGLSAPDPSKPDQPQADPLNFDPPEPNHPEPDPSDSNPPEPDLPEQLKAALKQADQSGYIWRNLHKQIDEIVENYQQKKPFEQKGLLDDANLYDIARGLGNKWFETGTRLRIPVA